MSGSSASRSAGEFPSAEERPRAAQAAEFSDAQWYAVQTRYRFEKRVAVQLHQKNCEVYLPLLTERRVWSDRKQMITTPLFPGYAFVHIDRSQRARRDVLQTAGLIGFVSFGGKLAPVPQPEINNLQLLLQSKGVFSLHPFVHAGQRVRVKGGCLNGLEGILVHHENNKLVISIGSIQRSLAVEIAGYELEII